MARHGEEHLKKQSKEICSQLFSVIQSFNIQTPTCLDFGIGIGRVAIPMKASLGYPQFGIDIDPKCVDYINNCGCEIKCTALKQKADLPYEQSFFDIIIAISVFTHFNKDLEDFYLKEVSRILKIGGIALLTVSGAKALESRKKKGMEDWLAVENKDLEANGFIYKPKPSRVDKNHGYTLHSPDYVRNTYSKYFNVEEIKISYIDGVQDLIICKKEN